MIWRIRTYTIAYVKTPKKEDTLSTMSNLQPSGWTVLPRRIRWTSWRQQDAGAILHAAPWAQWQNCASPVYYVDLMTSTGPRHYTTCSTMDPMTELCFSVILSGFHAFNRTLEPYRMQHHGANDRTLLVRHIKWVSCLQHDAGTIPHAAPWGQWQNSASPAY